MKSTEWDQRYRERPQLWSREPNRFLVEAVDRLTPGRALDLACGQGRNALWLAKHGWSVTGIDFSAVAIERARTAAARLGLSVTFRVDDVTEWAPGDVTYDLVTVLYLHLERERVSSVIRHAAAAVAPGGTLLVVAHHLDNIEHGHGGPSSPDVLYTESDITSWIEGLDVYRSERAERPVQTEDGVVVALDALVLARRSPAG